MVVVVVLGLVVAVGRAASGVVVVAVVGLAVVVGRAVPAVPASSVSSSLVCAPSDVVVGRAVSVAPAWLASSVSSSLVSAPSDFSWVTNWKRSPHRSTSTGSCTALKSPTSKVMAGGGQHNPRQTMRV